MTEQEQIRTIWPDTAQAAHAQASIKARPTTAAHERAIRATAWMEAEGIDTSPIGRILAGQEKFSARQQEILAEYEAAIADWKEEI